MRLGKYGKKAGGGYIAALKRAAAAIGQNFGAVIPESALLEIIESKHASEQSNVYQRMHGWAGRQISKLVPGQTMTADGGASPIQSKTRGEAWQNIADSGIMRTAGASGVPAAFLPRGSFHIRGKRLRGPTAGF